MIVITALDYDYQLYIMADGDGQIKTWETVESARAFCIGLGNFKYDHGFKFKLTRYIYEIDIESSLSQPYDLCILQLKKEKKFTYGIHVNDSGWDILRAKGERVR